MWVAGTAPRLANDTERSKVTGTLPPVSGGMVMLFRRQGNRAQKVAHLVHVVCELPLRDGPWSLVMRLRGAVRSIQG